MIAMAFGAIVAGPAFRSARASTCTGGAGAPGRVAFEALLDGGEQDVLALVRSVATVGIGAFVATSATDGTVGCMGEGGAAPPHDRDVRRGDPDRLGLIPLVD